MRSLACLLAFGFLCIANALEELSPEQALAIHNALEANPELLRGRHLLQHGPESHQKAECKKIAQETHQLCPIYKHYISVCQSKFGVHTLMCTSTTATMCLSKAYSVNSAGKCVCSKGYEHYYGVCIPCPKGKVKNVISYGQCKTCALGKYQPARGKATCVKCDITINRVNKARSTCTLRSGVTPVSPTPTKTPVKTPTPAKTPTKTPTVAPTTSVTSPPPAPVLKTPPSPITFPPPAPVIKG